MPHLFHTIWGDGLHIVNKAKNVEKTSQRIFEATASFLKIVHSNYNFSVKNNFTAHAYKNYIVVAAATVTFKHNLCNILSELQS